MKLKYKIISTIIYHAVTLYCKTWRFKLHNYSHLKGLLDNKTKVVVALWHDQLVPLTFSHKDKNFVTIASDSKDGSYITYILKRWGFHVGRGSSTRMGIKAALGAIKLAKQNSSPCAVTIDGPLGPRHVAKNGAVFIAKQLDCVIINAVVNVKWRVRFNSWDRFVLPLPFAKIDVYLSDPMHVSDDCSEQVLADDTERMQKEMEKMTNEFSTNIL